MKNDPIKRFIEENKQAFDEFLPAPDVLPAIKAALKQKSGDHQVETPKLHKPTIALRIAVAAAIILVATGTLLYFVGEEPGSTTSDLLVVNKPSPLIGSSENQSVYGPQSVTESQTTIEPQSMTEKQPVTDAGETAGRDTGNEIPAAEVRPLVRVTVRPELENERDHIIDLLNDPHSSSIRLEGVLSLAERSVLDPHLIGILEHKLATDPSINVRMAALDLLIRHSPDAERADEILAHLSKQDDPIMQLSLMNLAAGLTDSQFPVDSFRHCLNELIQNPATLAMVKEEAAAFLFAYEGVAYQGMNYSNQ